MVCGFYRWFFFTSLNAFTAIFSNMFCGKAIWQIYRWTILKFSTLSGEFFFPLCSPQFLHLFALFTTNLTFFNQFLALTPRLGMRTSQKCNKKERQITKAKEKRKKLKRLFRRLGLLSLNSRLVLETTLASVWIFLVWSAKDPHRWVLRVGYFPTAQTQ